MFFSYTSYYLAIAAIPLSLAVTLFFCCPLFITILSVIFLKEKMDRKGWAALFSGFLGVLVIMGPDLLAGRDDLFVNHYGPFLAVLSGFFYAVNAVCTRKFGIHESGSSLVFYPILTYLLFGSILWMIMGDGRFATDENKNLAFLLRSWTLPGNQDLFYSWCWVLWQQAGPIAFPRPTGSPTPLWSHPLNISPSPSAWSGAICSGRKCRAEFRSSAS